MITYQLIPIKDKNGNVTCYQARAVQSEMIDIEKLAEHMSNHNTPYSPGAIEGVLIDMCRCIRELAMEGKSVKIRDLGIFKIGIEGKNVEKIEDWNPKTCIQGVRLVCQATGKTRKVSLTDIAQLQEAKDYTSPVVKDDTTGGGTTGGTSSDNGSNTGGSGSDSGSGSSSDGGNTGGTGYEVVDDGNE